MVWLMKVYTRAELEFIADLCKKYNVVAVSDEVYENLIYPPAKHVRIGMPFLFFSFLFSFVFMSSLLQ